ncbi:hypothetical protein GALL_419030 [mine drainage metagenome]|uniref:Uncharacterized protein n=1 Tax=mine drainage metagenome TaxID=410659 RepID=A0A1J5PY58_9ZZZZ
MTRFRSVRCFEIRSNQHILVRAAAISTPGNLSGLQVKRRKPAAHAHFATAVADQYLALDDKRCHGHGFAKVNVAELDFPHLLAGFSINGYGVIIQRVEHHLAVGEGCAAVDDIAARNTLGGALGIRFIHPFNRAARLLQIQCIQDIRIWRNDIHGTVDYQRPGFVTMQHASGKGPCNLQLLDIGHVDLCFFAEAGGRIVFCRHGPLHIWRSC